MKKLKEIPYKIIAGVLDALLPNFKNSVELKESDFKNDISKYEVDYIRFCASIISFMFIILSVINNIDYKMILELLIKLGIQ
jgi:hypothetical protein